MANSANDTIRILHIDDDPSILQISKQILTDMDSKFKIDFASSVDEAFQKLSNGNHYDIIISDYDMPLKNGLDFLKELKEKKIDIPFILFTGKGREEIAIKALNLGADGYFNKQGDPETVYGELSHGIESIVLRKRVEDRLSQSEHLTHKIINSTPNLIYIYDIVENRNIYSNKEVTDFLGYTPQQVQAMGSSLFVNILHPDDSKAVADHHARFIDASDDTVFTLDYRMKNSKGEWRWLRSRDILFSRTNDGKGMQILGTCEDITYQKKAEQILAKNEARYRELYENSPLGYQSLDVQGCFIEVNQAWLDMLGYTREEVIGYWFGDFLVCNQVEAFRKRFPEFKSAGKIHSEFEMKRKDGSIVSVAFEGRVGFDEYGNFKQTHCVMQDVTESKRARLELESKFEVLERVAGSLDSGIAIIGRDYRVVWVNSVLANAGFKPNHKCYETILRKDVCTDCGVRKIFEENVTSDIREYQTVDSKGEIQFIELRATPLKDRQGNITGAIELAVPINERKKAEEKLRESEEKFRNLSEESPNMIFINKNGKVVYANKKCTEVLGFSLEEFYSPIFNFLSIVAPEAHLKLKKAFAKHLKGEEVPSYDYVLISKNGSRIEVEINSKLVDYEGGKAILGVVTDISERKKAEMRLRQSKLILENSSDSIIVTDLRGNITSWNKGAENIFGYTSSEMVGQSITKVVKPQEREQVAPKQLEDICKDKAFAQAWEGVRADGSTIWLMLTTKLLKNEKDEPIAMVGFGKDITVYKKAQEQLEESEAKFRAYVENSPVGVFVTNNEGQYEYVNQAATKLLGYTKQELLKMHVTDIVFVEDIAATASEFASLKKKGTLCKQNRLKAKGDKEVFVILNAVALQNGKLIGFCENVSSLKKAEEEIRKSHKEMLVVNEKLQVVGSLTRHDVANKLMSAKANIYLLRKKLKIEPELFKYLDAVDDALNQSSKIFEFSKIYERIGAEKLTVVNVADAFEESAKWIPHPNVEILNRAQGLSVLADSMLQQLFYNLIDNSLKHGKSLSTIRLSFEKDGKSSRLVYEDNGVGIPNENKLKIFSEGFTTGGSGLGLKMVKRMVEVYGWNIAETGKEGKGARFEITIPNTLIFHKTHLKAT